MFLKLNICKGIKNILSKYYFMNWYKKAKKDKCKGWIAVRLPKTAANEIKKWSKNNIPDNILFKEEEHGRELDTHITIIYGTCENDAEIIKEIVKDQKSIKVELGKVGFFRKNKDFDVVIIKIISNDLHKIHNKIKKELNVKETYPIYKPHSCIAYVKKGEGNKFAGDNFIEGKKLTFNKIIFINNKNKETELNLLYHKGKRFSGITN